MDAAGERNGLASAIMEHAASLVNYASALYTVKRFPAALEAYEQALQARGKGLELLRGCP